MTMTDDSPRVHKMPDGWVMRGHPGHTVFVPDDGRWQFDGNMVRPTFTPSIDERTGGHHFFVRNGMVEYLNSCNCNPLNEPATPNPWPIPPWDE